MSIELGNIDMENISKYGSVKTNLPSAKLTSGPQDTLNRDRDNLTGIFTTKNSNGSGGSNNWDAQDLREPRPLKMSNPSPQREPRQPYTANYNSATNLNENQLQPPNRVFTAGENPLSARRVNPGFGYQHQ